MPHLLSFSQSLQVSLYRMEEQITPMWAVLRSQVQSIRRAQHTLPPHHNVPWSSLGSRQAREQRQPQGIVATRAVRAGWIAL
jgi:hypothetical protein